MATINSTELHKQSNENERQYIWRVGQLYDAGLITKDDGLTKADWNDLGRLFNSQLRQDDEEWTESAYRKPYQNAVKYFESVFKEMIDDKEYVTELETKKLELQKEKCKLRDYSTYVNQQVRDLSRIESLKDIVVTAADGFNKQSPFLSLQYERSYNTKKSGILLLSDWHVGLEINNYLNKYDISIFKNRITQVVSQAIDKIKLHQLEKLYVVNLNDLISGIIHSVIRLQNRENLINQIIIVSETLSELLVELSKYTEIEYYSTLDNHSRAVADKKESLDTENFSRLIDWFLRERLKDTDITICENELDEETCTFQIYSWNYLAVHGNKDKVSNIIQNLSLMTKRFYNTAFLAHYHHSSSDEIHSAYVIANGCVSGVDAHSKDLRKTSNPSQNLIIVSENDCLEEVCILKLK